MKKSLAAAALALGLVSPARSADGDSLHPLLGAGLTSGGETLATVHYTDGSSSNIRSGGLLAVYGGLDYRFANRTSLQATIGYHVDNRSARNGSLRFERYPIELLGYYGISEQFRLGLGIRYVTNPRIVGSGIAGGNNLDFENTTGAIVEGEYLFSPRFGLKVRAVNEKYTLKGSSVSVSGNHGGVYFSYYF